ncbi:MAG: TetR/AcrR family transcriptional regulator [Chloroflexi bacterium]|nr:TetR/AcrR family transcriptional regulator [Chloroflexota bacterium]
MWRRNRAVRNHEKDSDEQPMGSTRERILEAAMEVFAQKGYHGAIVDDIVRASDTSKGSFYFHFPNKQGIFLALVDQLSKLLAQQVEAAIAGRHGGVNKVDAAICTVLQTFAEHRKLAKLLLVEAVGLGQAFDRKLLEVHARFAQIIKGHLDRAVEDGDIPPVDTEIAAYVWLGAISEVVIRWLYTGQPEPLEQALPTLRILLLRSIGVPQSRYLNGTIEHQS